MGASVESALLALGGFRAAAYVGFASELAILVSGRYRLEHLEYIILVMILLCRQNVWNIPTTYLASEVYTINVANV